MKSQLTLDARNRCVPNVVVLRADEVAAIETWFYPVQYQPQPNTNWFLTPHVCRCITDSPLGSYRVLVSNDDLDDTEWYTWFEKAIQRNRTGYDGWHRQIVQRG